MWWRQQQKGTLALFTYTVMKQKRKEGTYEAVKDYNKLLHYVASVIGNKKGELWDKTFLHIIMRHSSKKEREERILRSSESLTHSSTSWSSFLWRKVMKGKETDGEFINLFFCQAVM